MDRNMGQSNVSCSAFGYPMDQSGVYVINNPRTVQNASPDSSVYYTSQFVESVSHNSVSVTTSSQIPPPTPNVCSKPPLVAISRDMKQPPTSGHVLNPQSLYVGNNNNKQQDTKDSQTVKVGG